MINYFDKADLLIFKYIPNKKYLEMRLSILLIYQNMHQKTDQQSEQFTKHLTKSTENTQISHLKAMTLDSL